MKVGDLVARKTSEWVIKNGWSLDAPISRELFGCAKEVFGVIIDANPKNNKFISSVACVRVLTTEGNVIKISKNQLEVIGS